MSRLHFARPAFMNLKGLEIDVEAPFSLTFAPAESSDDVFGSGAVKLSFLGLSIVYT